ncbi:MAG: hypothetical protein H7068_12665 [Pedobacter sp.]|nr:hypothetical protein [Chitinophagaceae bacterium]
MNNRFFLLILIVVIMGFGCAKQSETLTNIAAKELYPISVGKTFTYRLDSTVVATFGASLQKKSYLAKDSIESSFLDNQGRQSYRIFRYITDTLLSKPYQYSATYYAVIDNNKIEYVDNNLRFIPLVNPVSANTTWAGNSAINTTTNSDNYYLNNWQYQYQNINQSYTVKKGVINNTVTILQQDESSGLNFDPNFYYNKTYSVEVYGKGVGLIYKDFLHYTYQVTPSKYYETGSYGIRLSLVDYK